MAELTLFAYLPGSSMLHSLDPRFKLISLILISLAGLRANPLALLIVSFMLLVLILTVRLSIKLIFKEVRYFFILLFFVICVL